MCIEIYARFSACPHTHFMKWIYCSLSACQVPAAGRACRKYRRRVKGSVSGRGRECAECIMDRKISEEFGEVVLASVREELGDAASAGVNGKPGARKRRCQHRRDYGSGNEVPMFLPMPLNVWAWPGMAIAPVGLPHGEEAGPGVHQGHKRERNRHDIASLHSRESSSSDDTNRSRASGVWNWLKSSLGGRG
jgi:hypothetical protein